MVLFGVLRPSSVAGGGPQNGPVGNGRLRSHERRHAHALYFHGHSAVHALAAGVQDRGAAPVRLIVVATPREAFWAFGALRRHGRRAQRARGARSRRVRAATAGDRGPVRRVRVLAAVRRARASAIECSAASRVASRGSGGRGTSSRRARSASRSARSLASTTTMAELLHRARPAARAEGVHLDRVVHGAVPRRDRRRDAPHAHRARVARLRSPVDLAGEGGRQRRPARCSSGRTSAASGSTSRCLARVHGHDARAGAAPPRPRQWVTAALRRSRRSASRSCASAAWADDGPVTGPALEVRRLAFAYPDGHAGAVRRGPRDRARGAGRAARPERRRQDHARAPPERRSIRRSTAGARRRPAGRRRST